MQHPVRLHDLPADLLLHIWAACKDEGSGLLGTCSSLSQLLRPAAEAAWRTARTAADASRSLAALRPARFAALQSVSLRADTTLTCDLEQLQLPQLRSLHLDNILFSEWGFNDITHLTALTSFSVDTWSGGRAAALNECGTLGALSTLPTLRQLSLRNLFSDHGLQHLQGVTSLAITMLNHSYGAADDTDEEAEARMDDSLCAQMF
ncbi:hypothetical protein ABPG75_011185 [Micractinium tetrahymenae]